MWNALLAALLVAATAATAQTAEPDSPARQNGDDVDARISQEVERRLAAAREELREEIRAQLATQTLATDWQEEWVEERRKLELFTLNGFYRLRPVLHYRMDLGQGPGRALFPVSPREGENTQAGADMRLRLAPTLNISEEVRVKVMVDMLDNILMGSTPMSGYPRDGFYLFDVFNDGQVSPRSAINALRDSVHVREAFGEVSTPVGLLRFGRMNAHWGLGILRNDGNQLDGDFGDFVDRVMFITEPLEGFYVTPMFELNSTGISTRQERIHGQPVDLTNADDAYSFVLAVARRDTPQQVEAKLANNQGVLNYGLHFSLRNQRFVPVGPDPAPTTGAPPDPTRPPPPAAGTPVLEEQFQGFIPRDATLYIPDLWLRYEERNFRVELEVAAFIGRIGNWSHTLGGVEGAAQTPALNVLQFGGAAVGEYRLLNGQLNLQLELGFASGDRAPGFGAYPARAGSGPGGVTVPGDVDGPQFLCGVGGCADGAIRNFRFNRAYRVDNILWREMIGTVTDAFYAKPRLRYTLAPGFDVYGAVIYSQSIYPESTPSFTARPLGVETNLGARYVTEDGFVGGVEWSVLFPLAGLRALDPTAAPELQSAQVVRGWLAIRF
jgi:uncharacterized protein (TIGR04551 family)